MKGEKINLEELEEAKFKVQKQAFEPKTLTCSICKIKTIKEEMEITLGGGISIKSIGFKCPKCKKQYLGLEQARKLDKALILSRVIERDFKIERSLSFDGDNWIFRIPKEFTHSVHKKKIEITPLGAKEFCALIR